MSASKSTQQPRSLTPDELALFIRTLRETRQWSQEQLAEISRLSVRTIQRVEKTGAASLDTRRALTSAFDFRDIDALNKPIHIPSAEELKKAKEDFDHEHVILTALPLTTGRQLAKLVETCSMDLSEPAFELSREAAKEFATLVDCFRDYRDYATDCLEAVKLEIHDELQSHIDALQAQGISLRYAERKLQVTWDSNPSKGKSVLTTALYVVAFPLGKEPEQFATPKSVNIGF